jgi:hypothetical protein
MQPHGMSANRHHALKQERGCKAAPADLVVQVALTLRNPISARCSASWAWVTRRGFNSAFNRLLARACERNVMARRQPPGFERRSVSDADRRRAQSPDVSSVEGLLAEGGSLESGSQPFSTTRLIPSSIKRRATAGAPPPKNSPRAKASNRCRVKGDNVTSTTLGFLVIGRDLSRGSAQGRIIRYKSGNFTVEAERQICDTYARICLCDSTLGDFER